MEYVISDYHFGHRNIIDIDKRNFSNVNEMNDFMIKQWNSVVGPDDIVYDLGDMFYKCSSGAIRKIRSLLNGKIIKIKGNHDGRALKVNQTTPIFESVHDILEVEFAGFKFVLCHYPIFSWNQKARNAIHIHGHIHNSESFTHPRAYNAFCMNSNYVPQTFVQVLSHLKILK